MTIKKGFLKKTYPTWKKIYSVSFRIIVKKYSGNWVSVMHFTTGGDSGYGGRIPAVWIYPGEACFAIWCDVSGKYGYQYMKKINFSLGKKYDITIQQTKKNYKYWCEIIINGSTVVKVQNTQPRIFYNVKEYLSDPWYHAFTSDFGTVSNLKIKLQ